MAVKERRGDLYLYFRPFKNEQIGLKVEAATKTEARQLEAILTRACRTGNYAGLDGAAREACLRMFENQCWELPPELYVDGRPKEKLTLWEASKLFLKYPEIRAKTSKALAGYTQALVKLASFLGEDVPIKELWVPHLKAYQIERLNQGAAPSTINTELSALSRLFAVMIEMQFVDTNPVRLVRKLSTKGNEREVYLSRETVQSIADKCPVWYQRIIWAAYFSGMRRGEILNLTRKQVNLARRMIHLEPEDVKENRRKRVPIHHELVPILEEAMRTPYLTSDKVFLVQDDQGIRTPGTDTAANPWPRACEALKKAKMLKKPFPRFHDLRHTWRTNARRSGMDFQIAESIMGHWFKAKSVNDRYGRISDQELIQAIDRMTFDHGETEVIVARPKQDLPEKKCEHFVNMDSIKKKKASLSLG